MHKPYAVEVEVKVKEGNTRKFRTETRLLHICARNSANASRKVAKATGGKVLSCERS